MSSSEKQPDPIGIRNESINSYRRVLEGAKVSFLATSQEITFEESKQDKIDEEKKKYEKN